MPLIQLIFQSTLVDEGSANLSDIFHTVRIRNKNKGITGLILCSGDRFFEVLEGENEVVQHTYQRICEDARHRVTEAWGNSDVRERAFSKWVSGFRRAKRGVLQVGKLEDTYFFVYYDLSQLRESSGLMQAKLHAFHRSTSQESANVSPFSLNTRPIQAQSLAA